MSLKNWGLLFFLSVLWGGSFFFVEVALTGFTPFTIVFLRVAIAAALLTVFLLVRGKGFEVSRGMWPCFIVMAILNNVLPFSLLTVGQTQVSGSIASILNASTPIFTVILAHFLTDTEKMRPQTIFGAILGFIGIFVLILPSLHDGFSLKNAAQIAILCAAISYGLASIWGRRMVQSSALVNTWGTLVCSSFILLPIMLITEEPFSLTPSLHAIGAVGGLGAFSTAVAYLIYFRILSSSGATYIVLVTFLIPITAMALGTIFLGEALHPVSCIGMVIIFSSLALIDGRVLKKFSPKRSA